MKDFFFREKSIKIEEDIVLPSTEIESIHKKKVFQ